MKLNRTYLLIAISSIALVIVLIIQVNWIYETARMKEELFNEKAILVLSKTADAISSDTATYNNLQFGVSNNEVQKIKSWFNHYMKVYNIHIDYHFEVKPCSTIPNNGIYPTDTKVQSNNEGCYQTCITEGQSDNRGTELKLVFPEKEEYIIAEMGTPFIASVILIITVLVITWRTILSLLKEKQVSEHTTDFLNNMTHEFKTPLTNIALAGKMMIKDPNIKQEDKIKHYSGIILEENEKLRLQVEQMLSMTALERGEIPLDKTELDLHQLIHDSLKSISIQIENNSGNLQLNLKAEHFIVKGDKTHLISALYNLIDNSIKYSNEKLELLIETFNSDQSIILSIADNGIGIENQHQKKVFEKFFRVPTGNVHNVKGFGLGLAYVKTIVESHNGTIELQSEKEKGTAFIIRLPYV